MAISNYSELQTAVADWLHRADLASIVPDLIRLGELRIFREVRCRDMESSLSVTIASGVAAVPADYIELKFAYVDGTPATKLLRASASQVYEQYPLRSSTNKPKLIAREGSNFIFGPYPDSTYTIKGVYYARPTSIQSTANTLFTNNPDLYLMAALCEAAPYIQDDPRVQTWEMKYASIKQQMAFEDGQEYASGGGMAVGVM